MTEVTPALIVTGTPGGPNNDLPSVPGPVDPGYGINLPPVVDNGLPDRPAVWPPQRPNYPVDPDFDLPVRPGIWPNPPPLHEPGHPSNSLPIAPVRPTHPIYRPEDPNNELPIPPGAVWPPLPPSVTGEVLAFVWIVGVGYRWVCIDLDAEMPVIDNDLPLAPEPK